MSTEPRSILVWLLVLVIFLGFELPAHYGLVPWFTLSRTVWTGEAWSPIVAVAVLAFLIALAGHLELHWSAVLLVTVAVAGVLAIASRLLERIV